MLLYLYLWLTSYAAMVPASLHNYFLASGLFGKIRYIIIYTTYDVRAVNYIEACRQLPPIADSLTTKKIINGEKKTLKRMENGLDHA